DQREEIELAQRGVGRIELYGHPAYDWAGTGFLVSENTLLTTRRIAELFLDNRGGGWHFRPGITTWLNYRPDPQEASAGYRLRQRGAGPGDSARGVREREAPRGRPRRQPHAPAVACQAPALIAERAVYLIGYPVRDCRCPEPEPVARVFRDVYGVKRVQPGQ